EKDVHASRRSDAFAALSQDSQLLERCYTQYFSYTNALCPALVTTSPRGYYTINPTVTASTYSLTAVPVPTGPQAGDTECASFTLDNTGKKAATNSGGQNTTSVCWTN
ncbi:MAG: type IV pilin protein, partial [Acidiferrobacterales bacterium]